jgi:GTP-binding protein Era
MPRAGIVTVAGKPNAGKSTLLNRIVGEKLAIVSPKPQSTRDRIVGIHSTADAQIVLLDTPGLLDPRYALQRSMRATALAALRDADVILYLADATNGPPPPLAEIAGLDHALRALIVPAMNKVDLLSGADRAALASAQPDTSFISASTGEGLDDLVTRLAGLLPESPFLYPEDELSTQTVRFFAAELVRETAFEQLDEELPYGVACVIEEFRETQTPLYIRAILHVERESQKRILIGSGGQRIRAIGRDARRKIETLVGSPVYLDLWVKVLPNWRRNPRALERLGYTIPEDQKR